MDSVYLWLGANVMLEYPLDEAFTLLKVIVLVGIPVAQFFPVKSFVFNEIQISRSFGEKN